MAADFIKTLKLFFYIQKSHFKTAFLSIGDALSNVVIMLINNLSFIFMWWVIFHNKGSINGWDFSDMLLLNAVMNNAFAIFALFARGIQALPEYIDNGSLDNYLVSPQRPLFMIATSESTFANWGDLLTGLICWILSGYTDLLSFALMIYASLCAAAVLISYRLIVSTLAFFAGDTQKLGDNIFMAFITFSSQPASIFTGWYKIMFLSVIPAGFISLIPVMLIKTAALPVFLFLSGAAVLSIVISAAFFRFGLKRYASGNRFGVR